MRPCRRFAAFALGLASTVLGAGHATARANEPAASNVERDAGVVAAEGYAAAAFDAYGRKAYAEALSLYRKAFSSRQSADIIYNIARIYDVGLGDEQLAVEHYELYTSTPGASAERIEIATKRAAELRSRAVETDETPSPGGVSSVPGARASEAVTEDASKTAAPSSGPPPRAAAADSGAESGWSAGRVTALALWGAGGVSAAVGIGFAVSAQAESDAWQPHCEGNLCTSQSAVNAAESAKSKADVATLALAAGGALLTAGTAVWLLTPTPGHASSSASVRLEPQLGWTKLALALSGAF